MRLTRSVACFLLAGLGLVSWLRAADDDGFKPIFNGKDLTGWDGNADFWRVEEGAIVGETTPQKLSPGNTFLIWRQGELDDFELKLEYRITSEQGGNSGVQYRSFEAPGEKWVVGGYQADIETGDTYSGTLYGELERGPLADRGQKVVIGDDHKPQVVEQFGDRKELLGKIKQNDWNEYDIIAEGNHLTQRLNGHLMVDVTDNDKTGRHLSGILALQIHTGPPMKVQFRNIRLKRLPLADGRKKIVLVAGPPSHGPGEHEFNAGVWLLRQCLDKVASVQPAEYHDGWPADPTAFDNANAVVLYMDGGGGHVAPHMAELEKLAGRGVGLVCMHYAVEVAKGEQGEAFKKWIGGYYESGFSTNPHWEAKAELNSSHPAARGVKPFSLVDEWYFNMRFRDKMEGVTSLLEAKPDDETRQGKTAYPPGPYPHIVAERGRSEILMWAVERPGGGRGVGFTGGHFHRNWANDDYRKLVLNALVWSAGGDVPQDGIASTVTPEMMKERLDRK